MRTAYRDLVTRIIAGDARSLPLSVPDAGTRPTSDRVRESLFGALEASGLLDGAAVVDLFAGSGALGLESVSRGAISADLVEKSARAASVIDRNVKSVASAVSGARISVHRASADAYLRTTREVWDIAFIDPPYDFDDAALTATLALLHPHMSDDALAIVERSSRSPKPSLPDGWEHDRDRRYGDTTLWWIRVVAHAETPDTAR